MQLIKTKYLGPTNYRGSRIKAVDSNGNSVTIGYMHEHNLEANHVEAVKALLAKINIPGVIVNSIVFKNDYYHCIKRAKE